jgi:hypothetical protein
MRSLLKIPLIGKARHQLTPARAINPRKQLQPAESVRLSRFSGKRADCDTYPAY